MRAAYKYQVKYVDPSQVQHDLVRVWGNNLPVHGHAEAKFHWTYEHAVEPPDGVFVLTARNGDPSADEQIVGTAGVGVRTFHMKAQHLKAGLLADLAVDRAHRTALPALQLVRESRARTLQELDFAYGFPNRSAEGVFLRSGYQKLGTFTRYALVLRHGAHVRRKIASRALSSVAGSILDIGRMAILAPGALAAARGFQFEWLDDVDHRFDELWARMKHIYRLIGQRDSSFLRWRFLHHPGRMFRIACLSERADGQVCAYAVVEYRHGAVYLRDLFGHPHHMGKLLDILVLRLTLQGVSSVSMSFLGSSAMVELLRTRGFRLRESNRAIVFALGESLHDHLVRQIADVESWHLTDADEDI